MKPLVIEARDPLIARDGRPFNAGQRARTMDFVLPSTISGAVRTRAGSDASGQFTRSVSDAKNSDLRGPLLVDPAMQTLFVPSPLDALMLDQKHLHALKPLQLQPGTSVNLEMAPLGTVKRLEGKAKGMPKYWRWAHFAQWLQSPGAQEIEPSDLGINGPSIETRTHVKIDPGSLTAEESQLFSTSGLEFTQTAKLTRSDRHQRLGAAQPLGLYVESNADELTPHELWSIGGERRLSHWTSLKQSLMPKLPAELLAQIVTDRACRVMLLTPAYFKLGWKPEYLLQTRHGATPTLVSAAVGRPQAVSGWDYVAHAPKPTRRLAPAGSVFFLRLDGDVTQWCTQHWWQNISDEDGDFAARRDGFGLCVLGTWNGQFETPQLNGGA